MGNGNTDYQIVKASIRHVKPIASTMRTASFIALQSFGMNPRRALQQAFVKSFYCRTAIIAGRPVAMWGIVGTLLGDTAEPWLALSDHVMSMPVSIVREARRELNHMMSGCESLVVAMIPDDETAVRFALHLGFGDGTGKSRREMERRIKDDPAMRKSFGDRYVIPLTFAAGRC